MNEAMQEALNKQINAELGAFYTYLSMSAWFEYRDLRGFSAWMRRHAEEEMTHAMKILDHVNERNGRVLLLPLAQPPTEWDSPLAAFQDALEHEQHVTHLINDLVALSRQENDPASFSFLQWFVDEQVEEEALVDAAVQDLKLVGDYGPGLFLLDRELGAAQPEADA